MRIIRSVFAGLLALNFSGNAGAVTLSLNPAASVVEPGDNVSLELTISGLGNGTAPSLGDFDVDIDFDESRLGLAGYTLGTQLGDTGLGEAIDFSTGYLGGGVINVAALSLLEPDATSCVFCVGPYLDEIQADNFVLAVFDFTVDTLAPGQSTQLFLSINALGDGFGTALPVDAANGATLSRPNGTAPEPTTLTLIGIGLAGLLARRRSNDLNLTNSI